MNIEKQKLGIFLAQLRKDRNLTQRELADKLYVSVSTISKWEKGVSTPNIYFLEKIAEALEVPAVELIECQIDIGVEKAAETGAGMQEAERADERCEVKEAYSAGEPCEPQEADDSGNREETACTPKEAKKAEERETCGLQQRKDVKKLRRRVLGALTAAALCVALLLGYSYYCSIPVEMETIESYYIANSDFYNENIYFVIVEYSGKLTDDMAIDYAMEHQGNYEKWFDMADGIIFAFFRHYRGREHVMEADNKVVFVPYEGQ